MLLLILALQLSDVPAAPPCTPFVGGPLDGICPGPAISKNSILVSLLPTSKRSSAIAPDLSFNIARLLDSQRKQVAVDPELLGAGANAEFCAKVIDDCQIGAFNAWPIGPDYVPGEPYLLSDGRVRIEWLKEGVVEYLSFVTFKSTKVTNVETSPAHIPWSQERYAD